MRIFPAGNAEDTVSDDTAPQTRRRRGAKTGLRAIAVSMVLVAALMTAVVFLLGQRFSAPDWLRVRLAERAEQSLGGMQLDFADLEMVVLKGWRPRVQMRDLTLTRADGQVLLRLADAEASLSMRALLRGQVKPKRVLLQGAVATLRRARDGTIALSLGDTATPLGEAPGFVELLSALDLALDSSALRALRLLEARALTLRFEDLRAERAWTVDGGRVSLTREGGALRAAGSFALLSGRDYASQLEVNYDSRIGETAAAFGFTVSDVAAQDIATQAPALGWLNLLRAPISGALRGQIGDDGALGQLDATLQIGAGVVQPTDGARPIPFDQARTYLSYDPAGQELTFNEISVQSSWVSGLGDGTASLDGIENGVLSGLTGQFAFSQLRANPAALYPEELDLGQAEVDFRLRLNPFRLDVGQMRIDDGDGVIQLRSELTADGAGWGLSLDGQLDRLETTRILALWPDISGAKAQKWMADNLRGAVIHDANLAFRLGPDAAPDIYLDFGFSDAQIRYLKTLPPIQGGAGHATLIGNRMVGTLTAGRIETGAMGTLDIAGSSYIIPDVAARPATPAIARIELAGPVPAAMWLLNQKPLEALKKSALPVDLAQGDLRATGTLSLPMKNKLTYDEIEFHLTGTMRDLSSAVLVPGHDLRSEELTLIGDQDGVRIAGAAQIDALPLSFEWTKPLGKDAPRDSRVTGLVELSPLLIDTFGIGLPKGSVSGKGEAGFALDLKPGISPALTLRSDLRGVGVQIPALGWRKPAAAAGDFRTTVSLDSLPRVTGVTLDAAGLRAQGNVSLRSGGGLDRARFSTLRLGNWLDAQAEIVGQGAGQPPVLRITGGRLDLRQSSFGSSGSGEAGGGAGASGIDVALDRLQVTETLSLSSFAGRFGFRGGLNGRFRGRLNGATPVTGEMLPDGERSAFVLRSDDAGGVFRDAGLLTRARGGSFALSLRPTGAEGQYDGTVKVKNTRVEDAPAIAALLNAASIVGLLDELAGSGIQFADVEAKFRLSPGLLTLYSASAVGPSIGLSMDGRYDMEGDQLAMQGVISPLYLINGIGALLTRKGEGVIGFNYRLRGTAKSPSVQVNPLSVLTPGMFRDIFRSTPRQEPGTGLSERQAREERRRQRENKRRPADEGR